jgi:fumarate reductase subunit D
MAKSNKPIVWSLFAAGGTLAAFLAPVLVLLFLLAALGMRRAVLHYSQLHAFAAHWFGKLFLLTVIALIPVARRHRLRVTLHRFRFAPGFDRVHHRLCHRRGGTTVVGVVSVAHLILATSNSEK